MSLVNKRLSLKLMLRRRQAPDPNSNNVVLVALIIGPLRLRRSDQRRGGRTAC
jgi:hypothetical protein